MREADALYREAIAHLRRSRINMLLARAQLIYGEWLRRENRRDDAREQLRRAYEVFTRVGADGFAERARRELLAARGVRGQADAQPSDALTSQESFIARLARDGHTNQEIAAQLFISTAHRRMASEQDLPQARHQVQACVARCLGSDRLEV